MQDIPEFRCANPLTHSTNWTFDEIQTISTPKQNGEYFGCETFSRNYSQFSGMTFTEASKLLQNATTKTRSCNTGPYDWHITSNGMDLSIVNQWDLVCDKAAHVGTTGTIYMAGFLVGCLVASFLADRFGRKKVIMACGFFAGALGVLDPYCPNFTGFLIVRFFMSFFLNVVSPTLYVLALEYCTDSARRVMAAFYWIFYAFGFTSLAGIAYWIRDWRMMHVIVSAPLLICPALHWLIPESPRWLLSQGRDAEAIRILQKAAKCNGKRLSEHVFTDKLSKPLEPLDDPFLQSHEGIDIVIKESTNFFVVFKHWKVALRTLNLFFLWCISAFGYYGLSYLITSFSGNIFVNNGISGALEAPAYLLVYPLLLWNVLLTIIHTTN